MTALKIYRPCRIAPWSAKSLLRRHVDNNVDISEQFIGCTWCALRISRGKGCFAGRAEKGTIVTAYVLYCFDARGVIVVRYCFSNCSAVLF